MLFKSVHTPHSAADGGAARVAAIAASAAVRIFVARSLPRETKAGNANVLGLHKPAVLLHFFRNAFGAADHFASTAAAFAVAATTGVIASNWGYLLVCLIDKRSNGSKR